MLRHGRVLPWTAREPPGAQRGPRGLPGAVAPPPVPSWSSFRLRSVPTRGLDHCQTLIPKGGFCRFCRLPLWAIHESRGDLRRLPDDRQDSLLLLRIEVLPCFRHNLQTGVCCAPRSALRSALVGNAVVFRGFCRVFISPRGYLKPG